VRRKVKFLLKLKEKKKTTNYALTLW